MNRHGLLVVLASFSICPHAHAYLDNRYLFPINRHLYQCIPIKRSTAQVGPFFMMAHSGRDCEGDSIQLPALEGCYDLAKINRAMNSVGLHNPYYLSDWTRAEIPFNSFGTLHAAGVDWAFEYAFSKHWSVGAAFTFLHCSSRYNYCLNSKTKDDLDINVNNHYFPGREHSFEQARLGVNQVLGLQAGQWSASGMGDTELFIRFDARDEYIWKFKQVDVNLQLGCIAPSGLLKNLYIPASIPFGGNGHWGIFGQGSLCIEVTDDWFFNLDVFASKRFSKRQLYRMPLNYEPLPYGVIVDCANVSPGILWGVSPCIVADDLYDGFGIYALYTYAHHCSDWWQYTGSQNPNIARLNNAGCWSNEFFTLGLDYDFMKKLTPREWGPRFYFDWTLPTHMFGAKCVAKTHRVALGIEFHF